MRISIKEAFNVKPDFEKSTKEEAALSWLLKFRQYLLDNNIASFGDIIPDKKDISIFLKISTGTIQNALVRAQEAGFFEAKQCIGTTISDPSVKKEIKTVSKKDKAVFEIKKFLIEHKYEKNEIIPGILELSRETGISFNTTRLAINELVAEDILIKKVYKNNVNYILNKQIVPEKLIELKPKNLVKVLKENIKKYLNQNFKPGDKIPSNQFFAKMYNVNAGTINSSMKELNKEKIVLSRRGNYGSIFLGAKKSEKSMFMTNPKTKSELKKSYNYKWEKALENIKNYILKNSEPGDKIPSMKEFSEILNVSVSTVKRAVNELSAQEILYVQKGKFGGIFVSLMPEKEDNYQWLAINPKFFNN